MKPWRIIKIVLSALWLAVTLTGLIYWMVRLAYPWNMTNLWLIPLYLVFPVWAFVGALLELERPLLYRITKTFVIVLVLIPTIGLGLFGGLLALQDGNCDDLFAVYRLASETSDPSAYGQWDEDCVNELFPAEIPANAEDVSFSYHQVGIFTSFWQDNRVTLSFRLPKNDFDALRDETRNRHNEIWGTPEPETKTVYKEIYGDWEGVSEYFDLKVTFDTTDNGVQYELRQYNFD